VVPILSVGTTRAVAWFHLGETPSAGQILQSAVVLLAPAIVVVFLTSLSVLLGLLLLVIPGIYVLIRLQFAASALALDGQRGTYALRRSWQLVRGNFWRVLGITLLALLLGNLASAILSLPFVLPTLNDGPVV
jgi:membrane-anchored glycerophosphoryl diester phosphodiesterase (GDPDase)